MRKILVSSGYGAGWSSWISAPTKFVCEYQPIIEAIEKGEKLEDHHPAVQQFVKDCERLHNETPYLGGLVGLKVVEIADDDGYRIDEYDGFESLHTRSEEDWN